MMNKITLIKYLASLIIIVFSLSACTQQIEETESEVPPPAEQSPVVQPPPAANDDEDEDRFSNTRDELNNTFNEMLLSEATRAVLTEQGISVAAEDIVVDSEKHFSFKLVLFNDKGGRQEYPMDGYYAYTREYPDDMRLHSDLDVLKVEWGGVSMVSPSLLAVCSRSSISIINMEDLREADFSLKSDTLNSSDQLLGIKYDSRLGYVAIFLSANEEVSLVFFDDSGQFIKKESLLPPGETSVPDENPSTWRYTFFTDFGNAFCPDIFILDTEPTLIVFQSIGGRAILCNTSTYETVRIDSLLLSSDKGRYSASYADIDSKYGGEYLAVYQDSDVQQKHFFFDGDIHPYFRDYWLDEKKWNDDQPVVSAVSSLASLTVTLNYNSKTVTLDYNIKPEDLEQYDFYIGSSPNPRYSLHLSNSSFRDRIDGSGDYWSGNFVLQDKKTGVIYFLATMNGGYGGYWNIGFFDNDDIYVQYIDSLKVFSIGENGPVPQQPFLLPLGKMEDKGYRRMLFGVQRDPSDGSYIIVYAEYPLEAGERKLNYDDGPPFRDNYNYKVGICDRNGNLLNSYDTGEQIFFVRQGLCHVDPGLSGKELTISISYYDQTFILGVFNIKTCVFAPVGH